jgi:hypothetical protein
MRVDNSRLVTHCLSGAVDPLMPRRVRRYGYIHGSLLPWLLTYLLGSIARGEDLFRAL